MDNAPGGTSAINATFATVVFSYRNFVRKPDEVAHDVLKT
jgi:hypothetical protein